MSRARRDAIGVLTALTLYFVLPAAVDWAANNTAVLATVLALLVVFFLAVGGHVIDMVLDSRRGVSSASPPAPVRPSHPSPGSQGRTSTVPGGSERRARTTLPEARADGSPFRTGPWR